MAKVKLLDLMFYHCIVLPLANTFPTKTHLWTILLWGLNKCICSSGTRQQSPKLIQNIIELQQGPFSRWYCLFMMLTDLGYGPNENPQRRWIIWAISQSFFLLLCRFWKYLSQMMGLPIYVFKTSCQYPNTIDQFSVTLMIN